ncbi:MAG: TolC family protein [Desulfosoma sp.]
MKPLRGRAGFFGALFLLLWTFPGSAGPWERQTAAASSDPPGAALAGGLAGAVQTALAHHPKVSFSRAGARGADAGYEAARAGYLPKIGLSQKVLRSNNPVFVFGSLLEQARFGPQHFDPTFLNAPDAMTNIRTDAVVSMPLFDQRFTATRVAEGKGAQKKARLMEDWIRQEVVFGVLQSYYGVIVAREKVGVARDAVEETEAQVRRIRNYYEKGQVVRSDLLAAEVQRSEFAQQLVMAQGDYHTALEAFQIALGRPSPPYPEPSGVIPELAVSPAPVDSWITDAFAHRPDLAMVHEDVDIARMRAREAQARYLPRLDAFSSYGLSGRDWETGSSDYTLGLSLSWDLYDGRRNPGIDQARALLAAAEAQLREAEDQVRLQVTQAYEGFLAARARLEMAKKAVEQAREALRIVKDRYGEGLTTITEVLRAETAYRRTQWMELGARFDHVIRYAELLFRVGRLEDISPFQG